MLYIKNLEIFNAIDSELLKDFTYTEFKVI